jgi:hypothetical protein
LLIFHQLFLQQEVLLEGFGIELFDSLNVIRVPDDLFHIGVEQPHH